ncbi:MAG TPA: SRPBCC family protein [Planctomycetaceae bacterium]|nr:SRPBCC family protein [Planctomycetaceae bacterium]
MILESPATSRYSFVTRWAIPAPQERVWALLMSPEQWPTWWRGVERVELLQPGGGAHGLGAVRRYTWKSRLPYRLTFTMETVRIEPQTLIAGRATGELEGSGCWHLSHDAGVTHVRYDWEVIATKWWMQWLAPVARPLFEWNHNVVMEWGREGLRQRIGDANLPGATGV